MKAYGVGLLTGSVDSSWVKQRGTEESKILVVFGLVRTGMGIVRDGESRQPVGIEGSKESRLMPLLSLLYNKWSAK